MTTTTTRTATVPAVAYPAPRPVDHPEALVDLDVPVPEPGPHDLLVEVRAVSVNPVDVKVRRGRPTDAPTVLGFDAAGVVVAVGSAVTRFAPGDEVWYAGALDRPGSNARLQAVDERLVGRKPRTLTFTDAAALPLTGLTAWEAVVDKMRVDAATSGTLLVVGAAGGVGSVLVQLARTLTDLTVVGTASRPESAAWVREMGAHHVVDHAGDLAAEVARIAPAGVDLLFSTHTEGRLPLYAGLVRPFGSITAIDDPTSADVRPLKARSLSFHWELMFTRPTFGAADAVTQGDRLSALAGLVEEGRIRTTATTHLTGLSASTLLEAHRLVEAGRTIGKVVVDTTG